MLRTIVFWTMFFVLLVGAATAQDKSRKRAVELGPGMSAITPTLLEIASQTNFFLAVADQAGLDPEQKQVLEHLLFESRVYRVQRAADLDVEEAELRRLLTQDEIDLDAVRNRIQQVEAIQSDLKMHNIESLLKAIQVLTHQQHLVLVTQTLEPDTPGSMLDSLPIRHQ